MTAKTHKEDRIGLQPSRCWALFLDVDGTLLDIAPTPQEAVLPPGLVPLLERLCGLLGGAVALVSGRPLRDIDRLFSPLLLPAAGEHGAEIRFAANEPPRSATRPGGLAPLRAALALYRVDHPGVLVEDKGHSLTAHYRLAPGCEAELRALLSRLLADGLQDYEILESKMAFDVKPRRFSKGSAIEALMETPPFTGRVPVAAGDDVTDGFAFEAARRLGGEAIQVGPRPAAPGHHFLPDPASLRRWLATLADRLARTASCP